MLLKIKTLIRRFFVKSLQLHRPTNWPYISGDSFRSLAQHIFDESITFEPLDVQNGDIIFVRTNYLKTFFESLYPNIKNNFILISHNEDMCIDTDFLIYANEKKIIHWFAENLLLKHEKITPIPIGIYSRFGDKKNIVIQSIEKLKDSEKELNKIFYNFNINTNINIRKKILDILDKLPLAETTTSRLVQREYFDISSRYKFIASPPGNGPDCHRTWEVLYLNSIPIVERSVFTEYFEKLKLPLLVIEKWEDLEKYTEENLSDMFENIINKSDKKALFMPYWIDLIMKYKNDNN